MYAHVCNQLCLSNIYLSLSHTRWLCFRLGQLSEEEQEKYLVDFEHKYMDRM